MDDFRLEISAILVKLPLTAHQFIKQDVNTSREQREREEWCEEKKKKEIPSARVKKIRKIKSCR